MKKYAVAYTYIADNDLEIEFVEAESCRDAIIQVIRKQDWPEDQCQQLPEDLEAIKEWMFNGDSLVDVKELPQ